MTRHAPDASSSAGHAMAYVLYRTCPLYVPSSLAMRDLAMVQESQSESPTSPVTSPEGEGELNHTSHATHTSPKAEIVAKELRRMRMIDKKKTQQIVQYQQEVKL